MSPSENRSGLGAWTECVDGVRIAPDTLYTLYTLYSRAQPNRSTSCCLQLVLRHPRSGSERMYLEAPGSDRCC